MQINTKLNKGDKAIDSLGQTVEIRGIDISVGQGDDSAVRITYCTRSTTKHFLPEISYSESELTPVADSEAADIDERVEALIAEELKAGNKYFCGATGEFHKFFAELCCTKLTSPKIEPAVRAWLVKQDKGEADATR